MEAIQENPVLEAQLQEMVEAGVFYGCHKSKTNPKVKNLVFGNRGGIELIDLTKTADAMDEALKFISKLREGGGTFLLVATQPAAQESARAFMEQFNFPVVLRRWLGGILTNFKSLIGRKDHFVKLRSDFQANAFEHLKKKERLNIERDIARMEELFGGIQNMTDLPKALIVIDPHLHITAVREARLMKIPVVAFGDTMSNPDMVDYLVLGNTKSKKSIGWFIGKVSETLQKTNVTPVPKEEPTSQSPKAE
jgi:small subunit ribosomal protein S2